ncbi:hypothetical protein ACFXP3_21885 [Streptomyces sp. NPDC059096]|uniref:hypothetical protein n=1 Tax=Streptomyces sp. NPDC059096 TaxID=3346727 RepID=UPI003696B02C
MDAHRGTDTPWWYRIPSVAVTLISLSGVAIAVYTLSSGTDDGRLAMSLGSGLAVGLAAAFVQGMAQKRHDQNR